MWCGEEGLGRCGVWDLGRCREGFWGVGGGNMGIGVKW